MLKSKLTAGVFLLLLLISTGLAQSSGKVGIGVAILDFGKLVEMSMSDGIANATITVPFLMSPTFRLEPEVGYFSGTQKQEGQIGPGLSYTWEAKAIAWNIGVGIFPQKVFDAFTLYYGGRVGYMSVKMTEELTGDPDWESTSSGFYIAPAVGGEHNFSEHFSIGAEAQIVYAALTNEETDRDDDVDLTFLSTRALVFFRFYF